MDEVKEPVASIRPLRPRITGPAQAELADALTYLREKAGEETAERLNTRFEAGLIALCERVAREIQDRNRPFDLQHEAASLYFSRPVYRLSIETAKKRARRSSTGLWYAFYAIRDTDGDGKADTLSVVAFRHSAAKPFAVESDTEEEEQGEDA